ncbi:MAG TPA: 3-phosphoshikimate 1-carboxyvinyltransferase [Acidimicrobiales bacterium]|jgi:3-phosphoshikimate 1-carboxyvinyltransferase
MSDALEVRPLERPPDAVVRVPGSKSITNRALVCAALAEGTSVLAGALWADDTDAMVGCLRSLGIGVTGDAASGDRIEVAGCGGAIPATTAGLHVGLSGTTARFIAPVAALGHGTFSVDGAEPMRRRPMGPLLDALRSLHVDVEQTAAPGHLPFVVHAAGVEGGAVALSGDVSSQFLSGLLMAAPCFTKGIDIELTTGLVSRPYVRMTRSVMAAFGVTVDDLAADGLAVAPSRYRATTFTIEPDASTASYFFAAAAVCGGRVRVDGLGTGSVQGDLAFVDVLSRMGATVETSSSSTTVTGTRQLQGVTVDLRDLSDTVPTLAVVAAFATTPTTINGVGFIRGKESDRISAVVNELQRCGIRAEGHDDGMTIHPGTPHGATVETYDDHRIAMAFSVAGLRTPGISIADPGCVAKTFPDFFATLDQLRVPPPLH